MFSFAWAAKTRVARRERMRRTISVDRRSRFLAGGVVGPLVGAELPHLKDLQGITTGKASIGGAVTFDSII
jgi:uncharacterized membrane protein